MAGRSQRGSAIIMLFVAVALFGLLAYAFLQGSRGNVGMITDEANKASGHYRRECANEVNMAVRRLVSRGCGDLISYNENGSNTNVSAPTDGSCSVYHQNGGGVAPCTALAAGPADCAGLGDGHYNDPVSGHCYFKSSNSLVQPAAQSACMEQGGYLAEITSAAETNIIRNNIDSSENLLIGGEDIAEEGIWRWTQGELAGQQFWQGGATGHAVNGMYTNWYTDEPNADGDNEDCIAIFLGGYGGMAANWVDYPCDNAQKYLCEKSGQP